MTVYYQHIRALIDPEMSDPLRDGGRLQDVSRDPRRPTRPAREPVGIALLACQARELAFELLELAEQADRQRTADDGQDPRRAAAPRRARAAAAPPALALRAPGGAGRDRDRNRQRWEHAEVLRVLLAEEAAGRDQATIRTRRRASGLPAGKTFDAWEPERSVIPAVTQQALRTLEWIDRHEVLCVCGPCGTGKSHFIEALGHLAIDKGRTVAWHTPETLAQLLRRHRVDDSVNKAISKLIRVDLVVIDDVGLLPISADAAEALFRVVDAAYEKRSIAISSNIHPSGFDELMPKSLATATVERLLHHAHVLITDGQDSYRLAQATAGKGVQPLT